MLFSNIEIVKFKNGTYAVRKTTLGFFYTYRSRLSQTWQNICALRSECLCYDIQTAEVLLNRTLKDMKYQAPDYGTPVGLSYES